MYYGHAVAWVLGDTLEAARLGAAAVEVDYEPLPAIIDVEDAIDAESFQGAAPHLERGDIEAGFDAAAHVFSGELEIAGQEHFYLETHCALAPGRRERPGLHPEQHPAPHRDPGDRRPRARAGEPRGDRAVPAHGWRLRWQGDAAARTRRDRRARGVDSPAARFGCGSAATQDMTMTGKRHGYHSPMRVGFDGDGRLLALDATLSADGGWSLDLSEPVLRRALFHIDNAYWIPNVRVSGRVARTNKTSQTAFRGFGGPQGMLVIEDILGRCAPLLGRDADDLRRAQLLRAGQTTPYGQPVRHPERLTAAWDAVRTGEFAAVASRSRAFNAEHSDTKRAIAVTPVKFGISFTLTAFNQAGALVHVYKDGSVHINHGGTEMGQGLHTKMLQVAATALGVPLSRVRLAPTRTDKVPNTSATAASSSADLNGGAVKNACEQITDRLRAVAAGRLGVNPTTSASTTGRCTPSARPVSRSPGTSS